MVCGGWSQRTNGGCERRSRDLCDDALCSKIERSGAKEGRWSQEAGKGKWFFSLESLGGTPVCKHLNFSPVGSFRIFDF